MTNIAWTKAAMERVPSIITRRSVILNVPVRWRAQYPKERADTTAALEKLDLATCSRDAVDDIIGNKSWTELRCGVCENDRDRLVRVPKEYDEATLICRECAEGVLFVCQSLPITDAEIPY
jgi:hypothetical protein